MKNDFYTYLLNNRKTLETARSYSNEASAFETWAESEGVVKPHKATYTELLSYIDYCRNIGNAPHTIKQKNIILKHYFQYHNHPNNPALEINLKGGIKKLPLTPLTEKELDKLFENYIPASLTAKRNKIMLGAVIYQGIGSKELEKIEVTDLNLQQGTIYIPKGHKTNSRTLELKAFQLLEMQNYLLKIRPEILKFSNKNSDKLFTSTGTGSQLNNAIAITTKALKKIEPKLKNFQHIRTSVITHWVKKHGLRKAQYMAGHRYVSSTERYQNDYLEDLKNQLDIYHPF